MRHYLSKTIGFILLLAAVSASLCMAKEQSKAFVKAEFEKRYNTWRVAEKEGPIKYPYSSIDMAGLEAQKLYEMGPVILPYLMDKLEHDKFTSREKSALNSVLAITTEKYFAADEWSIGTYGDPNERANLYLKWWKEGRKETPQKFNTLYTKWDQEMKQGQQEKAKETLKTIRDMGFDVLPMVVQKIQSGDERLVPFVNTLMRKSVTGEHPTKASVLSWWKQNEAKLRLPDYVAPATNKK